MIEHKKIKRNICEHNEIKKYYRAPKDKKNKLEHKEIKKKI